MLLHLDFLIYHSQNFQLPRKRHTIPSIKKLTNFLSITKTNGNSSNDKCFIWQLFLNLVNSGSTLLPLQTKILYLPARYWWYVIYIHWSFLFTWFPFSYNGEVPPLKPNSFCSISHEITNFKVLHILYRHVCSDNQWIKYRYQNNMWFLEWNIYLKWNK